MARLWIFWFQSIRLFCFKFVENINNVLLFWHKIICRGMLCWIFLALIFGDYMLYLRVYEFRYSNPDVILYLLSILFQFLIALSSLTLLEFLHPWKFYTCFTFIAYLWICSCQESIQIVGLFIICGYTNSILLLEAKRWFRIHSYIKMKQFSLVFFSYTFSHAEKLI